MKDFKEKERGKESLQNEELSKTEAKEDFKKYHSYMKKMNEIVEKYANEDGVFSFCNLNLFQLYSGVEELSALLDCNLDISYRGEDTLYPYMLSFEYDGAKYFSVEEDTKEELKNKIKK